MIISREVLKNVTGCDFYDGSILHNRFAYKFFRNTENTEVNAINPINGKATTNLSRLGSIIIFRAPMVVTDNLIDLEDSLNADYIYSDDAINICIEIPDVSLFGGVCLQRLYNSHLSSVLAKPEYLNAPVFTRGDDIMVHKEHSRGGVVQPYGKGSVSIATKKNDAVLIHTGINITAGEQAPVFAYSTNLTDTQVDMFCGDAISLFYGLMHDIFISTTKVI